MKTHSAVLKGIGAVATVIVLSLVIVFIESPSSAFAQKKHRPKKSKHSDLRIAVDSVAHFTPTRTFAPHTVGAYFFPAHVGAAWTLQTVQTVLSDSGKVLRRDTVMNREEVYDTAHFSLQGLPILDCHDFAYRLGAKDTAKSNASYYVDDSIAMTVFNNSVSHQLNKMFLVAPITIGNRWHDTYGDSVTTVIAGYVDSVITPLGHFDSVLVTLTRRGYTDLRKFFAQGYGIIKSIFRSPGPGGHGIVIIETDMIECKRPNHELLR